MTNLYHAILTSVFNGYKLTFNYESQDRFEKAACLLTDVELYDLVDWVNDSYLVELFNEYGLTLNGHTVTIEANRDSYNDGFEWSLVDDSTDTVTRDGIDFTYNDCIQSATRGL